MKRQRWLIGFVTGTMGCMPALPGTPADDAVIAGLSLQNAYDAAKAALEVCRRMGHPDGTVGVADAAGVILVLLRSPGTAEPTIEAVRRKAYTAAKKSMSTIAFARSKGWVDTTRPGAAAGARPTATPGAPQANPFAGLPVFDNDVNLVPWPGGEPIFRSGKIVGAIGVSGVGGPAQDEECAKAGADAADKKGA